ncbi:MAG: sigma-70 family RNA polymerase sigma factor [Pirellulaceae bacterium]|nr:sigma-70 family RNA polymerase sigma factor [Pirellulaceae bacterium]
MDDKQESWDRYLPYLRVVAEQATRRSAIPGLDPSSIAQTAVTEAWKSRQNFRGESDEIFLAWMRGILANVMRTAVRNQIRRPQCLDLAELDETMTGCGDRIAVFAKSVANPLDELQLKERSLLLTQALDQLSSDHREVLQARHFEDRSFAEIAAQMNRSEAAIRMLWIRALRALRQNFLTET